MTAETSRSPGMSLNARILLGVFLGLAAGFGLRLAGPESGVAAQVLYAGGLVSGVFIALLKMVLVPLVFSSIALGVANLRLHQRMGRVWKLTLAFFALTTTLAATTGLLAANLFRPGEGVSLSLFQDALVNFQASSLTAGEFFQKLLQGIFVNPVAAMAQPNILAVVVFALLVGAAVVQAGNRYPTILKLLDELFALCMHMVGWIMVLAPYGIFALLMKLVAVDSLAVLDSLMLFVLVIVGTMLLHGAVTLPMLLWGLARVSPLRFWRGARPALVTAFATCSSSATLPVTLRCLEEDLGVKREVSGFVAPLGATINMDGTALYEAAAALFVANLAGIPLGLEQQVVVVLMAMLASVGAPGIPSAGMVTMVMVLQAVGLPAEAVAILIPIDRLLDTVRTAVNVEGDMVASLVVQRWTGEADVQPER